MQASIAGDAGTVLDGHQVTEVYRRANGTVSALEIAAPDGARFLIDTVNRGLSWRLRWGSREPDVWANPERYGFLRWFCPGHGRTGICQYGEHDEIRYTLEIPPFANGSAR